MRTARGACLLLDREHTRRPGRHVQEQSLAHQIVAVPVVVGAAQPILEPPRLAPEACERQADVTLTLVAGVVDGNDPFFGIALPGKDEEAVVRPVALPCRTAFEDLPLAVTDDGLAEDREQLVVKRNERLIDRLARRPAQVRR